MDTDILSVACNYTKAFNWVTSSETALVSDFKISLVDDRKPTVRKASCLKTEWTTASWTCVNRLKMSYFQTSGITKQTELSIYGQPEMTRRLSSITTTTSFTLKSLRSKTKKGNSQDFTWPNVTFLQSSQFSGAHVSFHVVTYNHNIAASSFVSTFIQRWW